MYLRFLPLTNDWILAQQKTDVVERNATAVTIVKFHHHIFRVRRIGLWRRSGARIQASILLAPVGAKPSTGQNFVDALWSHLKNL